MIVSGTETLHPYLKEKKAEEQEPTIIVDSRKANTHARIITEANKTLRNSNKPSSVRNELVSHLTWQYCIHNHSSFRSQFK
jgi:hypothetical protein